MLPAFFAVLLLSPFVASEIYVGQNPQNVNAVIEDADGNLIPVTGVADTIEVVDLNYGGQVGNESGIAVDITVTPINATSSAKMTTMPVVEYPSTISAPQTESSASPSSSSASSTPEAPPSVPPAIPNSGLPVSAPPSSGFNAPVTPFSPFSGFGASASPPTAFPFGMTKPGHSPFDSLNNLITPKGHSGDAAATSGATTSDSMPAPPPFFSTPARFPPKAQSNFGKNNNFGFPFGNFLNPFGYGKKKPPAPPSPFGSFIELGGSLGPAPFSDTASNTRTNVTTLPPSVNYTQNVTSDSTNSSSDYLSDDDEDDILSSLMSGLSDFSPIDSIKNLFFPDSSSFNSSSKVPSEEDIDSTSLMQNFAPSMSGSDSVVSVPLNYSSFNSLENGMNLFPLKALNSTFHQWSNPKFRNFTSPFISGGNLRNFPMPFFRTNGSLPTIFMRPSSNGTTVNFPNPFSSSSVSPISELLNSFLNSSAASFNFTNLFAPTSRTPPSLNNFLNSILNSTAANFNTASGPSLTNKYPSFLPPSMFGSGSYYDDYSQYPEGDEEFDDDSEDWESDYPSSMGFPPSFFGSMPTMAGNLNLQSVLRQLMPSGSAQSGFNLSSLLKNINFQNMPHSKPLMPTQSTSFMPLGAKNPMLSNILSEIQNVLNPGPNSTTPLSSLISSTFGPNRNVSLDSSSLLSTGLFNPFNFTSFNGSSPFNMSIFANYTPLSPWSIMVSALNNTGMFGDLSEMLYSIQDLSSLVIEAETSNDNKTAILNRAISDITSIWRSMNTSFQNFMKNMPLIFNTTSLPFSPFNITSSILQNISSFIPQNSLVPPPQVSPTPTTNSGSGSSFMAMPLSANAAPPSSSAAATSMQSDAPAVDQPQPDQPQTPATNSSESIASNGDDYFDYVAERSSTPKPVNGSSPASAASAPVTTGDAFSIGSAQYTWITAISFLAVILNQRMFS